MNKKPGQLVQADKTGDVALNDMVKTFLKEKYQKPGDVYLGTLHRLDRPVSGLVLFAKTSKAAKRMSQLFAKKQITKTYWAICHNSPTKSAGSLQHWLLKDAAANTVKAFDQEIPNAKKAELHYKLLHQSRGKFLLQVEPITGRSHQIRCQLAAMGCPIWGDVKYRSPYKTTNRSLFLLHKEIQFIHPVKKEICQIRTPLPNDKTWQLFSNHSES